MKQIQSIYSFEETRNNLNKLDLRYIVNICRNDEKLCKSILYWGGIKNSLPAPALIRYALEKILNSSCYGIPKSFEDLIPLEKKPKYKPPKRKYTKNIVIKRAIEFYKKHKNLTCILLEQKNEYALYLQITKYFPTEFKKNESGKTSCELCLEEAKRLEYI